MKNHDFDTVFLKSFRDLSSSEKEEMKDLFTSEDEFNQLKLVLNSINERIFEQEKHTQPSAQTKERLDHLFHQTYQNKGVLWYNSVGTFFISSDKKWHQQNAMRIAAVAVLFFLSIPFWKNDFQEKKTILVQNDKQKTEQASTGKDLAPLKETKITMPESAKKEVEPAVFDIPSEEQPIIFAARIEDKESASDMIVSNGEVLTASTFLLSPATTGFNHPDGIFQELDDVTVTGQLIFAVKENPGILDLLTATY